MTVAIQTNLAANLLQKNASRYVIVKKYTKNAKVVQQGSMLFIMITIFCDFRQKTLRFSSKPMF
jgi:hypothetical protein